MRLTINDETAERLMAAARSQESASATVARLLDESAECSQARRDAKAARQDIQRMSVKVGSLERKLEVRTGYRSHLSKSQRDAIDEARKAFQEFTGDDPECTGAW